MTQLPVINMNGSDGAALLAQYITAQKAVATAMNAIRAIDCHGRDYQTITTPRNAGLTAREEHEERLRKLSTVHYELELISRSVERQLTADYRPVA